jgi:hypothetical protein
MENLSETITSKRSFLKLSMLLPITVALKNIPFLDVSSTFLDDDIVIINGWVMLKSDFLEGQN